MWQFLFFWLFYAVATLPHVSFPFLLMLFSILRPFLSTVFFPSSIFSHFPLFLFILFHCFCARKTTIFHFSPFLSFFLLLPLTSLRNVIEMEEEKTRSQCCTIFFSKSAAPDCLNHNYDLSVRLPHPFIYSSFETSLFAIPSLLILSIVSITTKCQSSNVIFVTSTLGKIRSKEMAPVRILW